jgi:hypothetical protein
MEKYELPIYSILCYSLTFARVRGNYVLLCYLKGKGRKRQGEKEKGGLSAALNKLPRPLIG